MNNKSSYDLFRQVRHPHDVNDYYHTFNKSNILNVVYWNFFISSVAEVRGDIVECGVGRGRSLITIMSLMELHASRQSNFERQVFALDSFCGFPEPSEQDESARQPKKGEWSESPNSQFKYSPENLKKILEKADISQKLIDELNIIKGYFDATVDTLSTSKIALLHLDGDLYESIKTPLFLLEHKISVGGIIVLDDFALSSDGQDPFPGARAATNEFLKKYKNYSIRESMRGTPYLVKEYKNA